MAKEINGTQGTWALRVSGVMNIVTAIVSLLYLLAAAILAPSARALIDGDVFYDSYLYERGLEAFGVINLLYLYAALMLFLAVLTLFYGVYTLAKAKHSNRRAFFIISGIVFTIFGLDILFFTGNALFAFPTLAAIFMLIGGILSKRIKPLSSNQQAAQDYHNQWSGTGYQHGGYYGGQYGGQYGGHDGQYGQYRDDGGQYRRHASQYGGYTDYQYNQQNYRGGQPEAQNYQQQNAYDTAYTGNGYGWQAQHPQYQHGQQQQQGQYGQQDGQQAQYGQQYGQQNYYAQEHDQQDPGFAWNNANSSVEDYNLDKMDEVLGTSSPLQENSNEPELVVEPNEPEASVKPNQQEDTVESNEPETTVEPNQEEHTNETKD